MALLYDQFGREIQARSRPETREVAVATIRDRWSGYPSQGLTPQRLAQIFRDADQGDVLRQAELFEEMEERDPHIFSQFQIRKLAILGLPFEVLPAGEDAAARRAADFCREAIEALPAFEENLLDMLDAISKGYSLLEILWETSGREARIRELRWVHPKKVTFWNSMTPRILTEEEPVRGVDPPPFKCVYHRVKARSGYDTRAGIMRVCAWMYVFKNYALKDWVAFAEVYGMPLRLGKYQPGASAEDKAALLAAVRNLGSDAAGIISAATEIEFIEAASKGTGTLTIYEALATFCDAQVSKAILGQTLTSEAGGRRGEGSRALGEVHAEVRQDLIEADARALARTITRQVLRPLTGFTFGWDAPVPTFRFVIERPEDLEATARTYKILSEMSEGQFSREHLSERFNVPLPKAGETPVSPPGRAGAPLAAKRTAGGARAAALAPVESPAPKPSDAADTLADQLSRRTAESLDSMIERVRAAIETASSLEEVRDIILEVYGDLDATRLGELMQLAFATADLAGRFDAGGGVP